MTVLAQRQAEQQPPADQLLRQVARGDHSVFGTLCAVTSPRIYGLIRKVLVDIRQSDGVTQRVFLDIWRSAPQWDSADASATAWIFTIAHKRAVDRARESRVRLALRRLTAIQRRTLTLAYWDALSCDEIDERTGVSVETANARLRDGLRSLADVPEDEPSR